MNKVYGSFDDFKKSSSFPTMNALDTSNTNFAKAKISQTRKKIHGKPTKNWIYNFYLRKVICGFLRPITSEYVTKILDVYFLK